MVINDSLAKIISFPNKTILKKYKGGLEDPIFHLCLSSFSDSYEQYRKTKEMLMKVVYQKDISLYYQFRRNSCFQKYFWLYRWWDLKPQIHVTVEPRGIMLRIRVLVLREK